MLRAKRRMSFLPVLEQNDMLRKASQARHRFASGRLGKTRPGCSLQNERLSRVHRKASQGRQRSAALIRDLATDTEKRDMYDRLHRHLNTLARQSRSKLWAVLSQHDLAIAPKRHSERTKAPSCPYCEALSTPVNL